MTLEQFISGFLGASAIEVIASVCGFFCVFLIIKRNIWCWFFGFIQVTLFVYVFYESRLYSNMGLHIVYMFLQVYGWWNWRTHKDSNDSVIIEFGTAKQVLSYASAAVLTALLIGAAMQYYTDASSAFLDAFIASTSLVAQFLLTRRYLFNWVFWIVVNIVSIYLFMQQGLMPTATLYLTFLVMCGFGLRSWWNDYQQQQVQPVTQL